MKKVVEEVGHVNIVQILKAVHFGDTLQVFFCSVVTHIDTIKEISL
jgi:hypothetical protein